jgi:type 1 fimbria pilin
MKKNLLVFTAICLVIFTVAGPAAGSAAGDGSVTMVPPERGMYSIGDKLIFSGTNTDSDTTYLFITGPGLDTGGAQIQSTHPLSSPVIDGDASTFQAAITRTGNKWLWTWDTQNVLTDGTYTIYAVSKPRDLPHINETHYARVALIIMKPANNLTTTGAGSPGKNPADAGMSRGDAAVTITRPAGGLHLHAIGDTLTFSGTNTASGTTYLFITGPDPAKGLQIQSTHPLNSPVIDGDASTFLATGVGTDNRWSYTWSTRDVTLETGTYVVYAAGTPRDVPSISSTQYAKLAVIMMRPENMNSSDSNLSVPSVVMQRAGTTDSGTGKGSPPITIAGIAKGTAYSPVAIWILCAPGSGGEGHVEQHSISPDPATGYYSMSYGSDCIDEGNYHVVVQHPGQNNIPDIYLSGNSTGGADNGDLWVWKRTIQQYGEGKGTKIFKVSGPGSLQGDDAFEALVQAFNDSGVDDRIAIAPLPAVTSTGSDHTVPAVNNSGEEDSAQPRNGFSSAGPGAGPSFNVDTVAVDPKGDLAAGTPVTVSFRINFSETGNETFPSADELQLSTGLENPRWDHTLVLDGVENPRPDSTGRILIVSGWVLSYRPSNSESLKVTLSGTAPHVPSPANITLFTVTEFGSDGNPVAGPGTRRTAGNIPGTGQPVLSGTGALANPAVPVATGVTMIKRPSGDVAAGCVMIPRTGLNIQKTIGFSYSNISVFTPESAGNFSSRFTKTGAVITKEQAETIARKAFPHYSPDTIIMEYSDGGINSRMWRFDLRKDDRQLVLGTLDAYTGDLTDYNVVSSRLWNGTPEIPHPAATSMEKAQLTAENEIRERNGELPLKLVDSKVNEDGNYLFNYRRVIQGVPCYRDGIVITVDSGTGNVVMYSKAWYTPENAVASQSVPAISRDAAIALVEREAMACYPESAGSFRIVSADLRWMDLYNQETFMPAPGVIPLVWYVRFDDATIRAGEFPVPEEGWVDAQNGTLRSIAYFHCRSNCG